MVTFDWSFARLIAQVVTTTSVTPCSSEIQNGDILVRANPGPPGKWPLKRRELVYLLLSRFFTKFDGKAAHGPRRNPLDFGSNLDCLGCKVG